MTVQQIQNKSRKARENTKLAAAIEYVKNHQDLANKVLVSNLIELLKVDQNTAYVYSYLSRKTLGLPTRNRKNKVSLEKKPLRDAKGRFIKKIL